MGTAHIEVSVIGEFLFFANRTPCFLQAASGVIFVIDPMTPSIALGASNTPGRVNSEGDIAPVRRSNSLDIALPVALYGQPFPSRVLELGHRALPRFVCTTAALNTKFSAVAQPHRPAPMV